MKLLVNFSRGKGNAPNVSATKIIIAIKSSSQKFRSRNATPEW